jgi:iron complex transport system ATP-binding protein
MNARHFIDFNVTASLMDVDNVTCTLPGRGGATLLSRVSVSFAAGQVTAILGPNGAGKSTLMAVLTGQRRPSSGGVRLGGQPLADLASQTLARTRGCVAQDTPVAFAFTAREVVALGRYPHAQRPSPQEAHIVTWALQAAAVEHLQHRVHNSLSGGEKARVHLARALAQVWEPVDAPGLPNRWLLLDEPTAALDLQHQHQVLHTVRHWARSQGVGVVVVLHDLNLALRYADRCVLLQAGQVAASGPSADVLTPERIAAVWGVHAVPLPGAPLQYVFAPQAPVDDCY